jgi:hypothetical protein
MRTVFEYITNCECAVHTDALETQCSTSHLFLLSCDQIQQSVTPHNIIIDINTMYDNIIVYWGYIVSLIWSFLLVLLRILDVRFPTDSTPGLSTSTQIIIFNLLQYCRYCACIHASIIGK